MDLEQYDVLLGLNWFQATKAGLYPAQKVLKFEAEQIHLETDSHNDNIEEINTIGIDHEDLLPINFEILSEKETKITSSIKLKEEDNLIFTRLVESIDDVFAYDYNQLGCCNVAVHTIHTTTDIPIYTPRYRKSQYENDLISEEVKKMLAANIIRDSTSPWSQSIVLVPKPDNTKRICIDYRRLNAITVPDVFPLPRIQDILDSLSGSSLYTSFDLKAGYWQTQLDETSIPKTAFTTADGHYEFVRTIFGLRNAPSQFCRLMQILLGQYKFVSVYLDDLTIHSKTFNEHIEHIKTVLTVLRKAKLKLNKKKCLWLASSIQLLGHIVSGGTVKMDPAKIKAILERQPPTNQKQVQEFLGLPNYYRRYIQDYAHITYPVNNLLEKDVKFNWDAECNISFKTLKDKLTQYPILRQPDLTKKFVLHCDSSGYAIGIILTQLENDNNNYFAMDWVVAYGSRLIKGAEMNY
jgi:hypothetical protein